MPTVEENLAAYRIYLATHNIKTVGGAEVIICPLCTSLHAICVFDTGYLGCVAEDCDNPHHQGPPFKVPYKWASLPG
jgi:hypothetical protein